MLYVLQFKSGIYSEVDHWTIPSWSNPSSRFLTEDSVPAMFVLLCSKSHVPLFQNDRIFSEGDPSNSVTIYKIDEAGNVHVKHQPIGDSSSAAQEVGSIMHHQHIKLLVKVILGEI